MLVIAFPAMRPSSISETPGVDALHDQHFVRGQPTSATCSFHRHYPVLQQQQTLIMHYFAIAIVVIERRLSEFSVPQQLLKH